MEGKFLKETHTAAWVNQIYIHPPSIQRSVGTPQLLRVPYIASILTQRLSLRHPCDIFHNVFV